MKLKLISMLSMMMIWSSLYAQSAFEIVSNTIKLEAKKSYKNNYSDSTFKAKLKIRLYKTASPLMSAQVQLQPVFRSNNLPVTFTDGSLTLTLQFTQSDWPTTTGTGFKEVEKEIEFRIGKVQDKETETDIYELIPATGSATNFNACPTCRTVVQVAKETSKEENPDDKITLLNAYNFDFNNTVKSNYLFHFNFYLPPTKRWNFGINVGVMKINYASSYPKKNQRQENITRDILNDPLPGQFYDRQIVEYSFDVKNRMWSVYAQPMIGLIKTKNTSLSLHAHFELLRNDWSYKNTYKILAKDSQAVQPNERLVLRSGQRDTSWNSNSFYNGYFGGGATLDVHEGKVKMCLQATFGATTNYPNPASVNIDGSNFSSPTSRLISPKKGLNSFYLVRGNIAYSLSSNSTIILGSEIRGLMPKYDPLFALYAGLNLSLDSLLGVLK